MGTNTVQVGGVSITSNPDGTLTTKKSKGQVISKNNRELIKETARAQVFEIKCHGLKPSTSHFFTFGGVDSTVFCKQKGKKLGHGLTTNSNGEIKFKYHHPKVIDKLDITDIIIWEQAKAFATAPKVAQLASADGSSSASFTVEAKDGIWLVNWFNLWKNVNSGSIAVV